MQRGSETAPSVGRRYPWRVFWVLFSAGMLGVAAVLPYALALLGKMLAARPLPIPLAVLLGAQLLQGAVLLAIASGVGLLVAGKIGLGAPLLESWLYGRKATMPRGAWRVPMLVGIALGALFVLLIHVVFLPRIPDLPIVLGWTMPVWKRFGACFYGGIGEEIITRLFLLSIFLWLLGKVWAKPDGRPAAGAFWTANVVVALLFGLGHLPVAISFLAITPAVLTAILLLNGVAALSFGFLYWKSGLEAAMIAHFSADIVLHVIGPMFLKMT